MSAAAESADHTSSASNPAAPRPRKACTNCRSLKTRCLPTPNSHPQSPCLRCSGLDLVCEYRSAKRGPPKGRKRTSRNNGPLNPFARAAASSAAKGEIDSPPPNDSGLTDMSLAEATAQPSSTSTAAPPSPLEEPGMTPRLVTSEDTSSSVEPTAPLPLPDVPGVLPFQQLITPEAASSVESLPPVQWSADILARELSPSRPPSQPPVASFYPNEVALIQPQFGPPSLENYFEPDVSLDSWVSEPSDPACAPWLSYADPVDIGLLSEGEARHLLKRAMDDIFPMGPIFDRHFHTFERVRSSSPLFTAALFVAVRFFRPELTEVILDLAETNINRAMRRSHVHIPLVQALLLLVGWKRPQDRSAYYKIGLATRLLAQLRVSWDTTREFTSVDEERAHVDMERTMSVAFTTELSYSILLRLPVSNFLPIPDFGEMLLWAEKHRHLDVPGDMFMVFVAELWHYHFSPAGDLWFKSREEWVEKETAYRAVVNKWLGSGLITGVYRGNGELLGQSRLLTINFLGFRHGYQTSSGFVDCLESFAFVIKRVAINGELQFYTEAPLTQIVMPAILAYQARTFLSVSEIARVRQIVAELRSVFDDTAERVTRDHAIRRAQRSYRRIFQALDEWSITDDDVQHQDIDTFLSQFGYMFDGSISERVRAPEHMSSR
ncbi:hypothetical protein CspeluHIS016_0212080 [Cutaneotrichosporon spelunceum]|uniref:Zn(2)-C6 fungal-type domain-containing protein n=1 Tax=Cutaneotrichosporon spelunceum TaxID=1672016 RepID=A0AAD3YBQ5_9TREE|nr:hypothetical protein CspeluHIS016_0212080 [Cutaneotrichosporon spelunceum]